jgi:energy-coupling factor transport system ATP-binding protein
MDQFIEINDVSFSYRQSDREPLLAVKHVSLSVPRGSHTAVLGRNGSGKSTLARLINALEQPAEGTILVSGMPTSSDSKIWEIRRLCGMVFQNPDNQIVGTTVEEDVAFGPENLGFPQPEIRKSVDAALAYVGLIDQAQKPPHLLSGGQKQKLAIAGILAMRPSCVILDEATSMLDPISRQEFMALISRLIKDENLTVINITHNMEEVLMADHVYVMAEGGLELSGTPAEIFDQVGAIKKEGLDVPVHNEIVYEVARLLDMELAPCEASTWEKAGLAVRRLLESSRVLDEKWQNLASLARNWQQEAKAAGCLFQTAEKPTVIEVSGLSYTYAPDTVLAVRALENISFDVRRGELLGIIGHSGSGKSTLIQHLNGLIRAQQGQVSVLGLNAAQKSDIRKIRQRVGLLFQYPEHQLFEETVYQDIAFGPRRMGLEMSEVERRVLKAAAIVGLQDDELERSPFELSGGQRRRAAIAGVLAMEPDVMILDEPAAGLDPAGRDEILSYASRLRELGVTVILVSHNMEDIARLADRVLVLNQGKVQSFGCPTDVFHDEASLKSAGLSIPRTALFLRDQLHWLPKLDCGLYSVSDASRQLILAFWRQCGGEEGEPHAG